MSSPDRSSAGITICTTAAFVRAVHGTNPPDSVARVASASCLANDSVATDSQDEFHGTVVSLGTEDLMRQQALKPEDSDIRLAPPRRRSMWREWRVLPDVLSSPVHLLHASRSGVTTASRERVMVLPGFGSPDRHTGPLRHFLALNGFRPEGWGLGRNRAGLDLPHTLDDLGPTWTPAARLPYRGEASVPYLCDCVGRRLRERVETTSEPFALVGWSLGGYIAREVARDNPDLVSRVITMGAPAVGGPKYTAAAAVFRRRGQNLDWIESEIAKRDERPIQVPVTAIVSPSDAVVSEAAALDRVNPTVKHVRLDVSHLGMGFNRQVWQAVLEALE